MTVGQDWYLPAASDNQEQAARRERIRACLDFYYKMPLETAAHGPWSMMHHMIAWGADSRAILGQAGGPLVSTISVLCGNAVCDGVRLLYVEDGELKARMGPGLQGHEGQFLAMLAQSRVDFRQRILVDEHEFTVNDLIIGEQKKCRPRTELTFRLMGLVHYLHTDQTWTNDLGDEWSFPRLMDDEMRQPINGVTCGGTHRLMALNYAVRRRQRDGFELDGAWARAQRFTARYQNLAFAMQNSDGSFSSDFFRSRGSWGDLNRKLKTTGHMLEWMVFSLPHDRLQDRRLRHAVDYLTNLLVSNRYYDWDQGPLGHGIRALSLYDERVFGSKPGKRELRLAETRVSRPGRSGGVQAEDRSPPSRRRTPWMMNSGSRRRW